MNPALHQNDARSIATAIVEDLLKDMVPKDKTFDHVQIHNRSLADGFIGQGPFLSRPALESKLQSILKKHLGTALERDGRDIGTAAPQEKADFFAEDLAALEKAYDASVSTGVNVAGGGGLWLNLMIGDKHGNVFLGSAKDRGTY